MQFPGNIAYRQGSIVPDLVVLEMLDKDPELWASLNPLALVSGRVLQRDLGREFYSGVKRETGSRKPGQLHSHPKEPHPLATCGSPGLRDVLP